MSAKSSRQYSEVKHLTAADDGNGKYSEYLFLLEKYLFLLEK